MDTTVIASMREKSGRGESRRLRRAGMVPAVVHDGERATSIACESRAMQIHLQDEAFHAMVLTLDIGGKKIKALLRETQMHPSRREILHLDFQAVHEDSEVAVSVPLRYINVENAPGVKLRHGIFTTVENQVSLHCLPKDLPEFISVDAGNLEIGGSLHLSDVTPPPGVRFDAIVRGESPTLAILTEPKGEEAIAADEADSTTEQAEATPAA